MSKAAAATTLPAQAPCKFVKPTGNERQRLVRARTALVLNGPFFGLLALRIKLVEAPWIVTCGTDGKSHFYNPAYIAGLTDEECIGIWVHEILHITNGHPWRRGGRERGKWNVACDYAIDPLGKGAGYKIPNETINPTWTGWSSEQIYPHIPESMSDKSRAGGMSGGPQGQDGDGGDGDNPGQGQGQGDPRAPKGTPTKGQVLDADEVSAQQDQAQWKGWISGAAQVAKAQGKLPANLEMYIEEMLAPRVDWKNVLRRFMQQASKQDFDWRLPNRNYTGLGMYLPQIYSERVPPIVFGWDTSGSHYDKHTQESTAAEVTEIMREVQPERIHVAYCDATLQGMLEIEPGDMPQFKPAGGGGTDFRPVFEMVDKEDIQPACLIFMTDCMGTFPDEAPPYPVLWLSTIEPSKLSDGYTPPFGELLYLDLTE